MRLFRVLSLEVKILLSAAGTLFLIFFTFFAVAILAIRPGMDAAMRSTFERASMFVANDFEASRSKGADASDILNDLAEEIRMNLPGAVLILFGDGGKVLAQSTGCTRTLERVSIKSVEKLRSPEFDTSLPRLATPCSESLQFLSATPLQGDSYLALYAELPLIQELNTSRGLLKYGFYLLPIPLLAFFLSGFCLFFFYGRIRRQMSNLLEKIRRFMEGELSVRTSPNFFRELNEISEAFNEMADEYQSKTASIANDDETRQEMLTSLVHDVRTPLTALRGTAELLAGSLRNPERQTRYTGVLEASLRSFKRLAESVEELASLDRAEARLRITSLNPAQLCEELQRELLPIAERKFIRFTLRFDSPISPIQADEDLIKRALSNLLDNAFRYSPEGTEVVLGIENGPDGAVFFVSDSGPGIAPDHQERIFQEFYRAPDQEKSSKGFGVGLAFVQRVMEIHGGKVECRNRNGSGARFDLCFLSTDINARSPLERNESISRKTISYKEDSRQEDYLFLITSMCALIALPYFAELPSLTPVVSIIAFVLLGATAFLSFQNTRTRLLWSSLRLFIMAVFAVCASIRIPSLAVGIAGLPIGYPLFTCLYGGLGIIETLLIISVYVFVVFTGQHLGTLALGMAFGAFFGMIPAAFRSLESYRQIGKRIAGLGILVIFLTSSGQSLLMWFSVPTILSQVERRKAPEMLENTKQWLLSDACRLQLDVCLSRLHQSNPFNSYFLIGHQQETIIQGQRQQLGARGSVPIHTEIRTQDPSRSLLYVIESPGKFGVHAASRVIAAILAIVGSLQNILSGLLLLILGSILTRRLGASFVELRNGIRRYRKGIYDEPITLPATGMLGETAILFNRLGVELPKLQNQVLHRAESRRRFIERLSKALRQTLVRLERYVGNLRASPQTEDIHLISEEVHQEQRLLRLLLHSFRHENIDAMNKEILPLRELLWEACDWLRSVNLVNETRLRLRFPDEEIYSRGGPEEILETFQLFFVELLRAGKTDAILDVELFETATDCDIRISVSPPQEGFIPDSLQFLFESFPQVLSELGIGMNVTQRTTEALGITLSLQKVLP